MYYYNLFFYFYMMIEEQSRLLKTHLFGLLWDAHVHYCRSLFDARARVCLTGAYPAIIQGSAFVAQRSLDSCIDGVKIYRIHIMVSQLPIRKHVKT